MHLVDAQAVQRVDFADLVANGMCQLQRLLKAAVGIGKVVRLGIEPGQAIECNRLVVAITQGAVDAQRLFVKGLGLGKITLHLGKEAQTVERRPFATAILALAIERQGPGKPGTASRISLVHLHFAQAQQAVGDHASLLAGFRNGHRLLQQRQRRCVIAAPVVSKAQLLIDHCQQGGCGW